MIDINKDKLAIGDLVVYIKNNKLLYGIVIGNTELFTVDSSFHDFDIETYDDTVLNGRIEYVKNKKLVCKVTLTTEFTKAVYSYMKELYKEYESRQEVKEIENKEFESHLQCGDILSFGTSYYVYLGLCTTLLECSEYIDICPNVPLSKKIIFNKRLAYTYMAISPYFKNTLLKKGSLNKDDFISYFDLFIVGSASFARYNKPTTKKKIYHGHVNIDFDKIENLEFKKYNSKYISKYIFNLDFEV